MLIILLILAAMTLLVYFGIFACVLLSGMLSVWSLWLGLRAYHGRVSAGGKNEIIVLLASLLLLVLASPLLFVAFLSML